MNNYDIFFSKEDSYLKKYLTKQIWEEYKDMADEYDIPFKTCVFAGIKFHDNKDWGICASSIKAYKNYHKLFDPYLGDQHSYYK
jgi:hypothetical protein